MGKERVPQAVRYVVHDQDGKILKSGACAEADLVLQARPGQQVVRVEGPVDDRLQEVCAGELRDIPGIKERIERYVAALKANEKVRLERVLAGDLDAAGTVEELKLALKARFEEK